MNAFPLHTLWYVVCNYEVTPLPPSADRVVETHTDSRSPLSSPTKCLLVSPAHSPAPLPNVPVCTSLSLPKIPPSLSCYELLNEFDVKKFTRDYVSSSPPPPPLPHRLLLPLFFSPAAPHPPPGGWWAGCFLACVQACLRKENPIRLRPSPQPMPRSAKA